MRKNLLIALPLSVIGIAAVFYGVYAGTAWQGPPPGCYNPTQGSSCNTDGVIWNQIAAPQTGGFNVASGKMNTATITAGATITGGLNTLGTLPTLIGDSSNAQDIKLKNGDLYFDTTAKSIRVDVDDATSYLKIGNYGTAFPYSNVDVTIFGNLNLSTEDGERYTTRLTSQEIVGSTNVKTPSLCLGPTGGPWDCRGVWPSGGVTSIAAGSGLSAAPSSPITGSGTLNINTGAGLIIDGSNQIVPNFTVLDGHYVSKAGDTMTGTLTVPSEIINSSMAFNNLLTITNSDSGSGGGIEVTAHTYGLKLTTQYIGVNIQGNNSYGIYDTTSNGSGYGAMIENSITGKLVYIAGPAYGIVVNGGSQLNNGLIVSGVSLFNDDVTIFTGKKLCLNGVCSATWPGATANGGLVQTGATLGLLTSCTSGQVLSWNGSAWICSSVTTAVSASSPIVSTGGPAPLISLNEVALETTLDTKYVKKSAASCQTIPLAWPSQYIPCPAGKYMAGLNTGITLPSIVSITCCPLQ